MILTVIKMNYERTAWKQIKKKINTERNIFFSTSQTLHGKNIKQLLEKQIKKAQYIRTSMDPYPRN